MADVNLSIGGFAYTVACRDGEEPHLLNIGAIVDSKVAEARGAVGGVNEVRQLLFASLLLADELDEAQQAAVPGAQAAETPDPAVASRVAQLTARVEALAAKLESGHQSA
jgi:cell division protein ZapA